LSPGSRSNSSRNSLGMTTRPTLSSVTVILVMVTSVGPRSVVI
jgi:hypothetical protein